MKILLIALGRLAFLTTNTSVRAGNLRTPGPVNECIVSAISYLPIPGEELVGSEEEYGCDIDGSGSFYPLRIDAAQEKAMKGMAATGKIMYGLTKIDIHGAVFNDDGSITMPPGKAISVEARANKGNPFDRRNGRDLEAYTVEKHFLLFRVTDKDGKVHGHTPEQMSGESKLIDGWIFIHYFNMPAITIV